MEKKGPSGSPMKVLILEESPHWRALYQDILQSEKVEMYLASNIEECVALFEALWRRLRSLNALIVGEMEEEHIPAVIDFLHNVRHLKYRGPAIAANGDADVCKALVEAGCNYSVEGVKSKTLELFGQIFKL